MNKQAEQEKGFLAELDANPGNVDLRLVFADWLEEQEDSRASQIRQLVDFHQNKTDDLDFSDPENLCNSLRAFVPPVEKVGLLSDFQKRLLPVWGNLWIHVAESAGKTDRQAAEQAICDVYLEENRRPPENVVWEPSPLVGIQRASDIHQQMSTSTVLDFCEFIVPRDHNVQEELVDEINNKILLRHERRSQGEIRDGAWSSLLREFKDPGWSSSLWSAMRRCQYGTMNAFYLSDESYYYHVCGEQRYASQECYFRTIFHCGWWWPFAETVVVTEKAVEQILKWKKVRGLRYADGFELTFEKL